MNELLDDRHLIDPPEPNIFDCQFCKEETDMRYLRRINGFDCCDVCMDDLQFESCGKCINICCCDEEENE